MAGLSGFRVGIAAAAGLAVNLPLLLVKEAANSVRNLDIAGKMLKFEQALKFNQTC